MTQLVLALVIVMSWSLGKWFPGTDAMVLFMVGAAVALFLCAGITALLARSASSRARGIALAVAGSYVVVLIGGLVYGFWILAW
jgi:hypothetical protein